MSFLVIASPPATHREIVLDALGLGAKRVLVEKPPFSSLEELEEIIDARDVASAFMTTSFVRRGMPSVRDARREFRGWRERFGALRAISVNEGKPWVWPSVATQERGAAGLESILYDDMPHPLDVACHLAELKVVSAEVSPGAPFALSPFVVTAELDVELEGGEHLDLTVRGSRTAFLANAIDFVFAGGAVTLEMRPPSGALITLPDGTTETQPTLQPPPTGPESFARLLREAAQQTRDRTVAADLEDWRSPQAVITAVLERRTMPAAKERSA